MKNLLDEENSWKLFREKAFQNVECPPELREVGDEIVRSCKGLALSIVVIGGLLLKSPKTLGYWKEVAKDLKLISNSKEKQESLDVLSLSYYHLPPHLKPCFLYMGVFKEDSEIRVSKIIRLWIAEGFIKSIGSQVLEDIGQSYIEDLIDRNLILAGRRRKYGKYGSCSIHDLLRDLCIKLGEEQDFFRTNQSKMRGLERRLVHFWNLEPTEVGFPLARSIMVHEHTRKPSEYRLLRVLDAGRCYSRAKYCGNVNLRYLAYQCHFDFPSAWKLPTSLSLIWNLQTLTVKGHIRTPSVIAPIEFWKVRQLRHVVCSRAYVPGPPSRNRQDEFMILENLQILKTLLNFKLCEEVCKRIPNVKKLGLVYCAGLHGYDDSLIECLCNLASLHKLESLSLMMVLNQNRELIKKLVASFPCSLKRLCLRRCKIHWEDLEVIGLLPHLEVLKLDGVDETGNWSPISGQFLCLKFLEIKTCNLVRWDVDDSHFPVLEKLHLEGLYSLEEIPLGIGDITTLELIRVRMCSASAAISAVKIKEDQLENGDLQVEVDTWVIPEESIVMN